MTYEQARSVPFNPFDVTKVWSHRSFPLIEVGRMTLQRNPVNYFAEIEQIAFAPAHLVPGIEPSPDKMLQGRLFSYADTHRHRLGVNYQKIPVNCPFATTVANYQRDGLMNVDGNQGNAPNYFPNSFSGPRPNISFAWHADKVSSSSVDVQRYDTGDEDNFTQPGIFFRTVLTPDAQQRLIDNIAGNLVQAQSFIQERAVANFTAVDITFGKRLREKLQQLKQQLGKQNHLFKNQQTAKLNPPRTVVKARL
jgi:catalase